MDKLAFDEVSTKEQVRNVLNFKKTSRMIIIAAAALVIVLSVGFSVNQAFVNDNMDGSRLLTKLGYTKELVMLVLDNRTTFSDDNEHINQIVTSLPLQSYRKYNSFYMQTEPSKEINVVYEFGRNYDRGGNGLDPFYDTVGENNALLLFAAIEGLEKVNFLHYDTQELLELNRTDSYTIYDLTLRFGVISPLDMGSSDLYNALGTNIQLAEFYFAHYYRIYLGAEPDHVSYRTGEPDEILEQPDGSKIWIYKELGKSYIETPTGEWEIDEPGYTAIYYFDSSRAKENDNLTGLYATRFIRPDNDGETYDEITDVLGYPTVIKDMGGDNTYIAYTLIDGQQRNAYFILHNDVVVEEGVMYGNDYTILEIPGYSDDL